MNPTGPGHMGRGMRLRSSGCDPYNSAMEQISKPFSSATFSVRITWQVAMATCECLDLPDHDGLSEFGSSAGVRRTDPSIRLALIEDGACSRVPGMNRRLSGICSTCRIVSCKLFR